MIKVKRLRVELVLEDEEEPRTIVDWTSDVFGSVELKEFAFTRGLEVVGDPLKTVKSFKPTGLTTFKFEAHKQGPEGETK